MFPSHDSILLGCLLLWYSFVGVRTRLASLLLAFSGAVGMRRVVMLVLAWTIWVLMVVATTIRRSGSAGIRFAVRVGGRRRGGVFVGRFASLAWFVVDAAYFRALLSHAFIVYDILSPLNTTAFRRFGFGSETKSGRPRLRSGEGETAVRMRRHIGLV